MKTNSVISALVLGVCSAVAAFVPSAALAQELLVEGGERNITFSNPIGRVVVDREGVIAVAAPTPKSLRISGVGEGDAEVSVYSEGGTLSRKLSFRVSEREGAPTLLSPQGGQVVAVDVQFAAVSSSTLQMLGFNFSNLTGNLQGAVVSPSSLNSYSFNSSGLSVAASAPIQSAFNLFLSAPNRGIGAVLSALSNNGLSQLLAQPTLLARSGEQASFLAGGEVPIPVPSNSGGSGGNTIAIEYKEFGVRLSVTPFVLEDDRIVLRVAPEVSELDYTIGVQLQGYVVPGLRRRSAETTVELGAGQSFVIAGLSYSNSNVSVDKVPFLGDIPILGALFKRQQSSQEQQELIIVVTPRLVGAMSPEDVPPLPGSATKNIQPTIGQMIVGNAGLDEPAVPFGLVRN